MYLTLDLEFEKKNINDMSMFVVQAHINMVKTPDLLKIKNK